MSVLCPCDWIEHDQYGKYVIDVYGKTGEGETAMLQIRGYKPYFYIDDHPNARKILVGATLTAQDKHDVLGGFNFYKTCKVLKVEVGSKKQFVELSKVAKASELNVYEANLPPLLRFYHDREISPASPVSFVSSGKMKSDEIPGWYVESINIKSCLGKEVPLLVAAYDIECTSRSGQFPMPRKSWDCVTKKIREDMETAPDDESMTTIVQRRLALEGLHREVKLTPFLTKNAKNIENDNWDAVAKDLEKLVGGDIGDPVIQIGITLRWSNDMMKTYRRKVFVWGSVSPSEDPTVKFEGYETEAEMIEAFEQFVKEEEPDIICGYNTYGFDDKFLVERAKINGLTLNLGRGSIWGDTLQKKTFELASGKYEVQYMKTPGRLTIDLLLNMRREHNLDSYTLDNVASTFLRDKVVSLAGKTIHTKTTRGLYVGNYVRFDIVGNTLNPYREGQKFLVTEITPKSFTIKEEGLFADLSEEDRKCLEWSFTKDDLHHMELFKMHEGSAADRAVIAKYCIQDCDLVLTLMAKLDTLTNARGMADVCFVPLQFLFLRGQGIKIYSRVAYEASKRNQIILDQESEMGDTKYEGAIVLPPHIGMYLDTPVAVLDFNSLYPSSIIGENLSPDTLVAVKTYDKSGNLKKVEGLNEKVPGSHQVTYDLKEGENIGWKHVCIYAQPTEDNPLSKGLIPTALEIMLKKRKEARKKMEDPGLDDAQKSVFNGLQLAYKVVANSIYGQLGSRTSPIRKICVAACTTAVGRRSLLFAKETVETEFGATVVYGDTDSIFVKFPTKDLSTAIKQGQEAATMITSRCPHKAFVIGYEKTFYPFILFCRKRYVGMKYEEDPTKCKRASMGIVLKRRDNAPIVKDVYGGALDILLLEKDVKKAVKFVKTMLLDVIQSKLALDKFVVTKQLRDDYAAMKENYTGKATLPAHRVLADRMTERDPGNAPSVGERIKYVHIQSDKKLQGERIEHVDYVKEKKLKLDAQFYITNQIQNPVAQLFALCISEVDGYREPSPSYKKVYESILSEYDDPENAENQEEAMLGVLKHKEKHLDKLLFLGAEYIQNALRNSRTGPLDSFFKKVKA
jgi:DNA polymerase elongation subunit (family B)